MFNTLCLTLLLWYLDHSGYNIFTPMLLWFLFGYYFSTIFLTPDLDTECKAYSHMGVFKLFWLPFKTAIKHRGITHKPIVGSLVILGYGLFCYFLIASAVAYYLHIELEWTRFIPIVKTYWREIGVWISGFVLADVFHIFADWIS